MSRKGFVLSIARAALCAAGLLAGVVTDSAAGQLSGRVTSSTTSNGLAGTVLRIFNLDIDDFSVTTTADSLGFYTVNLVPGNYAVLTDNNQGYINEIFNNLPCSSVCDTNAVIPIPVGTGPVSNIDFVLDPGSRIAGTITDAGGTPIANVVVTFVPPNGEVDFTSATSDAMGNYISNGGSATGNVYAVTSNSQGYRNEVYDNIYCLDCNPNEIGTPIAVTLGANRTGINFALDIGARIAGTVTNTSGSPVAGVSIRFNDSTGSFVDEALTDALGNYSSAGLPGGTYFASTSNNVGLVDELYNNFPCPGGNCNPTNGTAISVTVGNTADVDFVLAQGGTVTGTVTNASNGQPISDANVSIYNSGGSFLTATSTDDSGVYSFVVPAGNYFAATNNVPGFANQLYNNMPCPGFCNVTGGTQIPVTAGATSTANFALQGGGNIAGRVTNATTTAGVSGVSVQLFTNSGSFLQSTGTDASGNYTLPGIAAGTYFVRTNASSNLIDQLYNGITCSNCNVSTSGGTLVPVSAGSTTGSINFALVPGGRFSGRVTNASTGAGIQNVSAQIYNSSATSVGGSLNTDASGNYTTSGLPAGTYFSRTFNNLGFVEQLYNGMQCPLGGCTVTSGTPITVNAGAITPNVNYNLTLGGRISGQVLNNATGAGISGFVPVIYDSSGGVVGGNNADASGNYLSGALPPGNYFVFASPPGFASRLYNNRPCSSTCTITSGTPVAVTAGNTTGSINFRLNPQFLYTDNPLVQQVTVATTQHITELRTHVNTLRSQVSLGAFTFTDALTAGTTPIRAVHISELRTALNAVYDALVITRPAYTDPVLTAGITIKAAHISELRNAVEAVR